MVTAQQVPAFVINLDRRPDRLAHMTGVLGDAGISFNRVSALDAQVATDLEIGLEVDLRRPRIGMGRGSQCCAITNFNIYRDLVGSDHDAALILQDDIVVVPELRDFLTDLTWLPQGVGVVQFEKFGRPRSTRLAGPRQDCGRAGRGVHRMYSRTAGAGCYLITRWAAQHILRTKPLLDMPIDHFLFSPNVSPVFADLGVSFVAPAMAVQKMEEIPSDLAKDRRERTAKKTAGQKLRRLGQELNRLPSQIWHMARGARMVEFSLPPELMSEVRHGRD